MNDKKFIILAVAATIILLAGGIFFLSKTTNTPQIAASQNAKAFVADPTSFDLGQVSMDKGKVTKVFTIKNTGTDTLKLYNVRTSCHCTTAFVTINENNSPSFGMDSLSAWVGEVQKGREAKINVVFDPAYHGPSGMGAVSRFVSVETNDPAHSKLTFTLTGAVIK